MVYAGHEGTQTWLSAAEINAANPEVNESDGTINLSYNRSTEVLTG